jgi:hypothetical protein
MDKENNVKQKIVILTKSPWPEGRIGKEENQDWFKQCIIASRLKNEMNEIIVTSSTKVGELTERYYYFDAMLRLGIRIKIFDKGCETISQLEEIKKIAGESEFFLIVTWTHFFRVKYLLKQMEMPNASIITAWGIPRPKELVTDVILTIASPIMYWFNLTEKFLNYTNARRASGKL